MSRWIGNGGEVGNLTFPHDLTWFNAESYALLACAKVLVLHNYLDVDGIEAAHVL